MPTSSPAPDPDPALFEWVPNVSEGRDSGIVEHLALSLEGPGVRLVHRTSDPDHHRSVFTVIGHAIGLTEALIRLLRAARRSIDLSRHEGVHPRLGVVDVSPFIPLHEAGMQDAANLARQAARAAGHLLPVYLYGEAASRPERTPLVNHRRGGLEALVQRARNGSWLADEPRTARAREIDPCTGVLLAGARRPLTAFNVELGVADPRAARTIAARIRASAEGGEEGVLALGLALPRRGTTQVSMNLVDPQRPLAPIIRRIEQEARNLSVQVLRGELIGLIPLAVVGGASPRELLLPDLPNEQVLEHQLDKVHKTGLA